MATKIQKNTAQLMINKLQAKLDALYNEQEGMKVDKMKCGGRVSSRKPKKMLSGGESPYYSMDWPPWNTPADWLNAGPLVGANIKPINGNYDVNMGAKPINTNKLAGTNAGGVFGDRYSASDFGNGGFDWGNAGYQAGVAAPFFYNLFMGLKKPEQERASDYYNPYANRVLDNLRKRRYDIDPVLQANLGAQNIYNRNVTNASGGNRGQLLNNLGAGMVNRQVADANALSQASNVNNQYLGELAQGEMDIGQQMADINFQIAQINAANRAKQRQHLAQSASDLANMLQINKLMGNQQQSDTQKSGMFRDTFKEILPFLTG